MIFSKLRAMAYLLSFSMLLCEVPNEDNNTELDLYAQSAVLMDADSGRILYGKNEENIMANASTTKILTCILALELGNYEDYVLVSSNAARMPKVHLGMQNGQYFKLEDLLYSLMLESHNDSAVAIAEHIGGSVEGFAALMNEKAKSIGCKNTYFITPNGLDATEGEKFHSTTAEDLSKIMSYCILHSPKKDKFLEICNTLQYSFTEYKLSEGVFVKGGRSYSCSNKNSFLSMMEGVLAGKTGFTNQAGYCYVAALENSGRTFVVSLLACGWPNNKNFKWSDTKKLFQYGIENFHYENIITQVELPLVQVLGGVPYGLQEVPVYLCDNTETFEMLLCEDDKVEVKVYLPKKLYAPVELNQKVGKMEYYVNGEVVKTCEIRTKTAIEKHSLEWSFEYVIKKWAMG